MRQESPNPAFDQTLRQRVEHGDLDRALAELSRTARTLEDARTLAFLYTQRGEYERAASVLDSDRWNRELDAATLRLRGNALWHAGHLGRSLHDLEAAGRAATSPAEQETIRADVAVLRDEVALMGRVDRSLMRVDWATVVIAGLLIAVIVETHRRLFVRRYGPGRGV
jgi:hypothetical protein